MQIRVRKGGRVETLPLSIEEAVYLPWDRSTLLAFTGQHAGLKDSEASDVLLPEYHLGLWRGYVSGVLKMLPGPMLLAYNAETLLANAIFKSVAGLYHHPTGWVNPHPNIWQVPKGSIGGGAIVVRHAITMAYGRSTGLPSDRVEKEALMRQATVQFLEDLGYARKDAPCSSLEEND